MSDVEIELEDKKSEDKKPDIEIVEEAPKEAPKEPEIKLDDAIAELKSRLEEEQKARREAEQRAREFQNVATTARSEVEETNLHLINSAIDTLKRDASILKSNYTSALASNNYEKAAEIQEQMSLNATKLMKLEDGKVELEKKPKIEPVKYNDPVEEFATRLSPQSGKWIRQHPEYVTDPRLNQQMIGAHSLAMGKGIVADTPEYFQFIENVLDISTKAKEEPSESLQAPSGGRSTAPPPAPVSKMASTNGSSRPNVVRLSEAEREIADMMGMTYQEYAKNKLDLQKSGKLN